MNRLLIISILFFWSYGAMAQREFPAEIRLKSGDTLMGMLFVKTNVFNKDLLEITSFNEKLKFYDEDGAKLKIKARDINELIFMGPDSKKRNFVKIGQFKTLVEAIYSNKVKWYKFYYLNSYMERTVNEFFDEEGNNYSATIVVNNLRKKLKKLVKNDPEIVKFIDQNNMGTENILRIIKMYEEKI